MTKPSELIDQIGEFERSKFKEINDFAEELLARPLMEKLPEDYVCNFRYFADCKYVPKLNVFMANDPDVRLLTLDFFPDNTFPGKRWGGGWQASFVRDYHTDGIRPVPRKLIQFLKDNGIPIEDFSIDEIPDDLIID